jgi:hypothetical protein
MFDLSQLRSISEFNTSFVAQRMLSLLQFYVLELEPVLVSLPCLLLTLWIWLGVGLLFRYCMGLLALKHNCQPFLVMGLQDAINLYFISFT